MSSARTCIKCNQELAAVTILDVEVDRCNGCGGLWLDGGEIRALAEHRDETLEVSGKLDPPSGSPDTRNAVDAPCPSCGGKLAVAVFGPTCVEHCNGCHGMFLDAGELEKAVDLVQGSQASTIVALARSVFTCGTVDVK